MTERAPPAIALLLFLQQQTPLPPLPPLPYQPPTLIGQHQQYSPAGSYYPHSSSLLRGPTEEETALRRRLEELENQRAGYRR